MKQKRTVIARNSLSRIYFGKVISELCQSPSRNIFWQRLPLSVLTLICCLFISSTAWSQGKDTSSRLHGTIGKPVLNFKPLVVVDGTTYEGDIKNIDASTIANVTVLKDTSATKIYGPRGANGVILIQTKNYRKPGIQVTTKQLGSVADKDAVYVIDGKIAPNKLDDIKPEDILSITVLKHSVGDSVYTNIPDRGAVIVVTRQGAITSYRKKFGAFSKEYKAYFDDPQNNDLDFLYVVNGTPVDIKTNEGVGKLADIQFAKINEVIFKDKGSLLNNVKPIVVITTKK